jgi:hypothetical protein
VAGLGMLVMFDVTNRGRHTIAKGERSETQLSCRSFYTPARLSRGLGRWSCACRGTAWCVLDQAV